MATILLRSPYYEYHSQAQDSGNTAKSATLELSVGGTVITTMSKDSNLSGTTGSVAFEIADLCRDYLDITFNNTYSSQTIAITGTLTFKSKTLDEIAAGETAVTVGTPVSISHTGLDGYFEFMEGLGTGQNSAKTVATNDVLQDNTVIYAPQNTAGQIPYWNGSSIVYQAFSASDTTETVISTTFTIDRVCTKHEAYKVTFVNKYGALQDFYFTGKTTENINIETTNFKRSILDSNSRYSTAQHSKQIYNTLANETLILNTPPMSFDTVNEAFKQLLVSEQVWIYKDSKTTPINITSNTQRFKTGVNDQLIQYTITAEYAFDMISNIR
jgi:hypothetical protein|tara:strand:- start:82 stop:1065 length:984 start_codon:yes stop_codon:yes gene_type:complete